MSFYQQAEKIQYWRVIIMACAAFIFNTTEFVPVALLTDIAQSFEMQTAETGLMMTVYAWTVLVMSLPAMLATGKMERKSLLIKLFVIFIIGHILSVIAWNFWVLLIARMCIALSHAVFWSITASLVMRISPKNKKTQALGMLAIGSSLATILGLPLGRLIGQLVGWRVTFAIIAALALVAMFLIIRLLPRLPSKNAGSLASLPVLAKRPLLIWLYITTALIISAHFTAYTYIEPFMIQIGQFAPNLTTMILLVFGLSGISASLLFNRLYRFNPKKFVLSAMGLFIVSLTLLLGSTLYTATIFTLAFLWGIGISCIGLALQMHVLKLAPDATDVATAIYSGIFNAGIGAGALLGSQIMNYVGLEYIGFSGALLGVIGLTIFTIFQSRYPLKNP
ncbi:sugar transporter [Rodentibacter caecimuris]|uniref:Probable sugar efflux transporter n=1 Tax=Rodentibacter caecimuris TaxID=1796644 RepID=A0AAJ3N127_9PAST|nr:sugar transporter [Rodentibacter heylii]AOF53915.1 Sugar efflux transporter SotB [Pasteurellaceae bacterium NI1060]OOF73199.1 sugar transporter [Rodentibacter heylii]OOF75298.1 sugar transporter [Rodentibacter heylii]OOF75811.1 sugar transporter [Rodentibacter heylii]